MMRFASGGPQVYLQLSRNFTRSEVEMDRKHLPALLNTSSLLACCSFACRRVRIIVFRNTVRYARTSNRSFPTIYCSRLRHIDTIVVASACSSWLCIWICCWTGTTLIANVLPGKAYKHTRANHSTRRLCSLARACGQTPTSEGFSMSTSV